MFRLITLLFLISSGVASAAPDRAQERAQYALELNQMASQVMHWYSQHLSSNSHLNDLIKQGEYPQYINQIKITQTRLEHKPSSARYKFIVSVLIKAKNASTIQAKDDVFIFNKVNDVMQLIKIEHAALKTQQKKIALKYNHEYYQARVIAYSWLTYLDKRNKLPSNFDQVSYTLNVGDKHWIGQAQEVLKKRQQLLALGGHILQSVSVLNTDKKSNDRHIELIIEWKGENAKGTPVIAKIKQTLHYQRLADGQWQLLGVKENHLLPDNKPWLGLLC